MLPFKLVRTFKAHGHETVIAKFAKQTDAEEFMEAKVAWDHKTKVAAIYRLYHDDDLIQEIDASQHESGGESGGSGQTKRFNPTPLSTSLKPAGSVPYRQDDEDEDQ